MSRGAFKLRGADTNISSPQVPHGSTNRPFCATHAADIQIIQLDWEEMQIAKTSQTLLRLLTASCAVHRDIYL